MLGVPSAAELVERLAAERAGHPFLIHRDDHGAQTIISLGAESATITIGRAPSNRVCVGWDDSVSRVHAELVRLGQEWAISDDGLSRNGSFVNGERVSGRRRLRDGDAIRVGQAIVVYRLPQDSDESRTSMAQDLPTASALSPAQRRVLIALARPFRDSAGITPATNQEIAAELFLSVESVKTHLRALGVKFGVQDLPQNHKRAKLVERAFLTGVITRRDLA